MLRGNFIKYTRRVKFMRKPAGPVGERRSKAREDKTVGRGGKTSERLLRYMKTWMNSLLSTQHFRNFQLWRLPAERSRKGDPVREAEHCSLPKPTRNYTARAQGHSQISKETKLLKIPTDGLQSAGHKHKRAPWILGVPKNYQLLHKVLKKSQL